MRPAKLAHYLVNCRHPYVAFDIFDTLVARTVTPEHVKVLASDRLCRTLGWDSINGQLLYQARQEAERHLCQRTFSQHGELEFQFCDLANEILSRLTARGFAFSNDDKTRLRASMLDCELAVERSVLRPIAPAIDALEQARRAGKKIVFVSDFYLTQQSVARLLAPIVRMDPSDSLFVSCDRMASKRSGRLFQTVYAELGISPSDLLMVGDNVHSDYTQARANGIDAMLVREPERVAFYNSTAASAVEKKPAYAALRKVLSETPLPESHNLRAVVPSLYVFTEKLYGLARRGGLRDLCFLAREGEPLRRIFEIYQDSLGCADFQRIRTHYLLVSRRSCYAASLGPLESERFEGLFRYYAHMSARDFLQSLGFTDSQIASLSVEVGIDCAKAVDDFPASQTLGHLRQSHLFRQLYDEHRLAQRARLREYINGFQIALDQQPLALVDVGWKGSIQDYLRSALRDEVRIEGYYLGLLNIGQPVDDKSGLVFTNVPCVSPFYRTYAENRTLFEVLLCAEHGSALRYEKCETGGIEVLLDDDPDELAYIRNELVPLRDDVIAGFRAFCEARNRFCLTADELAAFAACTHAHLVFRPWRAVARMLASAQHRENFGTYTTSRYLTRSQLSLRDKWRFWRRLLRTPRETLLRSFWPALTLFQHTNRLVTRAYAMCRRAQDYQVGRTMTRTRLENSG